MKHVNHNNVPVQMYPSPLNPVLQAQEKFPKVVMHSALMLQFVSQSLTSTE